MSAKHVDTINTTLPEVATFSVVESDDERRQQIKDLLRDMRLGKVAVEFKQLKAIELEAKVLGLIGNKVAEPGKDPTDEDVNKLLDFKK